MLPVPTAEQIRTLAPDGAAARAGEQLATPRRWSAAGRTDAAAWGLCQGSGASPYEVAVEFAGPAYRCSCPSRKIPCKHALGLLFLVAAGGAPDAAPPDWVSAWLADRAGRAAAGARRAGAAREPDPTAQARRAESRERKVDRGIEELERWLADLVRRGLDSTRGEGYQFWDAMGARLVDAQAAGLARSVRGLGAAANAGEQWPHVLLEGAARLHLLCEAYRRVADLPDGLRADVRSLVGWTTREEDLDPATAVDDRWFVVGRRVDEGAGQVITARTWFIGERSGRAALHLSFGVDAAPPTVVALPGQAIRATLAFYPSATPLRAAIRPVVTPNGEAAGVGGGTSIEAMLVAHAGRLARNPFADMWPVVLAGVVPVVRDGGALVRDESGVALPVVPRSVAPRLLAASGGRPVTIVGEWDGVALRPLSMAVDGRLVDVAVSGDGGRPIAAAVAGGSGADGAWPLLVSAALLGTERSGDVPLPSDAVGQVVAGVSGADPERRLLATAALVAVRRRAGRVADHDALPLPEPAQHDPRPAVSGRAARLLPLVLFDDPALLGEYLELTRAAGLRLPDERLPDLLAMAGRVPALRGLIVDLGGTRAAWLTAAIPELATLASLADATTAGDEAWGSAADAGRRMALLVATRERDPAAGRALLEPRFASLPGDERAGLVAALRAGLSADDEPLLDAARTDRRQDVRRAATDLLVRLPRSGVARRLEELARPLIESKGRLRASLAVTLPTPTPDFEAAGFGGRAPAGLGDGAWLLRQVLAHVSPGRWSDWLGVDAPGLVERALRSDDARPVLEGWVEATARFGDAGFARALLAEPKVADLVDGPDIASVVDGLTPPARAALVASVLADVSRSDLVRLVRRCPAPWPANLGRAVIGAVARSSDVQYPDQSVYDLVRAAALAASPDLADDLATAATYRGEIRPTLVGAIDTIQLRRELHAAFADLRAQRPST